MFPDTISIVTAAPKSASNPRSTYQNCAINFKYTCVLGFSDAFHHFVAIQESYNFIV